MKNSDPRFNRTGRRRLAPQFVDRASAGPSAPLLAAFHRGLNKSGYIEGRIIAIEYRWAEGHHDRLSALAADLVRRKVSAIVAVAAFAASAVTKPPVAAARVIKKGGNLAPGSIRSPAWSSPQPI